MDSNSSYPRKFTFIWLLVALIAIYFIVFIVDEILQESYFKALTEGADLLIGGASLFFIYRSHHEEFSKKTRSFLWALFIISAIAIICAFTLFCPESKGKMVSSSLCQGLLLICYLGALLRTKQK